ncbi:MAG: pre-peptidase C-terminal domain-containing protein [Spirochaetales bacterium]|nr:pre-peptidase C-terminal domain-containing protein [Spirochaetales bacterium]
MYHHSPLRQNTPLQSVIKKGLSLPVLIFFILACENPSTSDLIDSLSNDANFTSIIVSANNQIRPLIPDFSPEITQYRVNVPPQTTRILFTGTLSNEEAQLSLSNVQGTASDGTTSLTIEALPLGVQISGLQTGENTLQAQVVAQDSSTKTYQLTVEVAPIPISLTWTDSQTPITEQDTVNGRTITFALHNVDLSATDLTIAIPLTYRDTTSQIGSGKSPSISFTSAAPNPSITLTGRATDDGNTDNERISISFGTPTVTGSDANNYTFSPITRGISFTVLDDDIPAIHASLSSTTLTEGDTTTLSLSFLNPSSSNVTVTPSGTGLVFSPTSLTLSSTTTTGSITVTITDDTTPAADRAINLTMRANPSGVSIIPSSIRITVQDNDLAIPSRFTATAGDARVSLSWQAVTDATSYRLYRSSGNNAPAVVTTTPTILTETSYVDIGLTNGTEYTYTVRAVNASKSSIDSQRASATPTDHGYSIATATPLSPNGGTLGGWLEHANDGDLFSIRLEDGQLFSVSTESNIDTMATLYTPTRETGHFEQGPASPHNNADFIFAYTAQSTGIHYLQVGANNSSITGNYYLHYFVGSDDSHGNTRDTATSLSSGEPVNGIIASSTDVDFFSISLEAGQRITATTTGQLDTLASFQDSTGTELATHDNINVRTNTNFQLTTTVTTAGTYYLRVHARTRSSSGISGTGRYVLTVTVSGS